MTREEIEKALAKKAPIQGQVLRGDRVLCSLDSTSGVPVDYGRPKPRGWLQVDQNPAFTVRLRSRTDLSRIHVIRNGPADSVSVLLTPNPRDPGLYSLQFSGPLVAGDYQFAVSRGELLLFPQCGFTVGGGRP